MPAFTIRPNGQGAYTGWTLGAGASKPAAMADSNDATYVHDPATGAMESYTLENLPATAGAISGSLTWHCRMNKAPGGAGTAYALIRYSGTNATAGWGPGLDVAIAEQTATFATPPTGGVWTPAAVNGLEAGFYNGMSVAVYAYDLWVTGTYTATTGGFGLILTMGVGPLLVLPSLADLLGLARAKGIEATAEELREAWAAYRAYRWPCSV